MVDNILMGNNADAMQSFDDAMAAKITDAIDAKKIEIASTLGQRDQEDAE
jgi:hypothetical protein